MLIKDGVVYRTEYEQLLLLTEKMHEQETTNKSVADWLLELRSEIEELQDKHLYLLKVRIYKQNSIEIFVNVYNKSNTINRGQLESLIRGNLHAARNGSVLPALITYNSETYFGFLTGFVDLQVSTTIYITKYDGTEQTISVASPSVSVSNYSEVY